MSSLLSLAPSGVFHALIVTNKAGVLLPHLFTLALIRRFIFCGTIPRVAPARHYLAPCLCRARTFLFKKIKAISLLSGRLKIFIKLIISSKFYTLILASLFMIIKHSLSIFPLINSGLNLL